MKHLTLFICTTLFFFSCRNNSNIEQLKAQIDSLQAATDSLEKELSANKLVSDTWYNEKDLQQIFSQNGITNPVAHIENSLREQPEIIPLEAILGGTMQFGKIQVLNNEWVIAEYEDGHIMGKAIFIYTINDDGQVDFELLKAIDYD